MDKAVFNAYRHNIKDSFVISILCGAFSGSGGGISGDWLKLVSAKPFVPTEVIVLHFIDNISEIIIIGILLETWYVRKKV